MFTLRRFDVPVLAPDAEPLRILHLSDLHLTPGSDASRTGCAASAGPRPRPGGHHRRQHRPPRCGPGVLRALEPLLDLPGRVRVRLQRLPRPGAEEPVRATSTDDREVPAGRRTAAPRSCARCSPAAGWLDLNNARTRSRPAAATSNSVGVDDPHIDRDDYDSVAGRPPPTPTCTSASRTLPSREYWTRFAADGYGLLLAGHTHGGQVCVPFSGALVTNCGLDRRMAKGLHRWPGSDAWLHVSAGLGTHPTAPVRFACLPEASLLTLVPR